MSEAMKSRNEIAVELTWDLDALFSEEAAYEKALAQAADQAEQIVLSYKDQLAGSTDPQLILKAIRDYECLQVVLDQAGSYAYLAFSVDMSDSRNAARMQKAESVAAEIASQLAFLESELMETDDVVLAQAAEQDKSYASFIGDIRRRKKHRLNPETEKVLAALSPSLQLPMTIYEQAKHADMDFPEFTAAGKTWPLSFVLFENNYNLEANTDIRRQAFQTFSQTLAKYQNTVAAAYNGEIQRQKTLSKLRGYASVFDYLLDDQKVGRDLYDRQIDLIMQELAPHMRRYARLQQQIHGLDKMTFADLKISLDPEYDPQVTIEQSKQYVSSGLRILGREYHDLVMHSFGQRWVDFAQNKGKSTGGFCATPYGRHAYILLSWTGRLSEVFTLVHELGHAAHFMLAQQQQPYLGCDTSLYFVEAPSTCNEMFLTQDLLRQNSEPRFQRWVLASMIQNTYYHNFVTHLLEAAYQREVYRRVDQGEFLQADGFNAIKRQILEQFWGDAVEINPGAELTWMRQPHYYMGLYSYTYSAGLTIATEVSQRVQKEGQPAVQDWLAALKSGGTVSPLEFALMAGVDITTEATLRNTIAFIGRMIDQIEDYGRVI